MTHLKRKISLLLLSVLMATLLLPLTAMAAETNLQTQFISVKETDEQIVASYDAGSGELPDHILYAVSKNGQFVWDGVLDANEGTGMQECVLDIPTDSLSRAVYDVVVWSSKAGDDGQEITSEVYAFKVVLGSHSESEKENPRIEQPKAMVVEAPFAYIAENADMESPICYLKTGDVVQVYTDVEENAVIYVTKGGVSGYMYARTLTSKVFDYAGGIGQKAVEIAKTRVGDPYSQPLAGVGRYLDCSYLAMWVYRQLGIELPRTAAAQGEALEGAGLLIPFESLQPGDLVFWSYESNGRYKNISHVGIFAGEGKTIEAANPKIGVVYRDLPSKNKIVFCARPQNLNLK